MKVINCGIVVYLITEHHIARIEYKTENGEPWAWIYYDGKVGEGVSAENGMTMKRAFELAKWTIKRDEYTDQHHDAWIATLLRQSGIIYRQH